MSDLVALTAAAGAGAALGAAFLRRSLVDRAQGPRRAAPGLWFFASLMLRSGLAAAGFYLVGPRPLGAHGRLSRGILPPHAGSWTARFGEGAHAP